MAVTNQVDTARDEVIARRLSMGDTLTAIGADLGVTRERIRQIAMRRLGIRSVFRAVFNTSDPIPVRHLFYTWCPVCIKLQRVQEASRHGEGYCIKHARVKRDLTLTLTCDTCGKEYQLTGRHRSRFLGNRDRSKRQRCPDCTPYITGPFITSCTKCGVEIVFTGMLAAQHRMLKRIRPEKRTFCTTCLPRAARRGGSRKQEWENAPI